MKTQKELIGMMKILKGVDLSCYQMQWDIIVKIAELVKSNKCKVIDKKWLDSWKKLDSYPLDLGDLKTWRSKNKLAFTYGNKKLHCWARCYYQEWDYAPSLYFEANLILPNDFVKTISYYIEDTFEELLKSQYEDFLEQQKKEWMNNQRKKLLSGA